MEINKHIKDYKIKSIDDVIGVIRCEKLGILPYDSTEIREQLLYLVKIINNAFKKGSFIFIEYSPSPKFTEKTTKEEKLAINIILAYFIKNSKISIIIIDYFKKKPTKGLFARLLGPKEEKKEYNWEIIEV